MLIAIADDLTGAAELGGIGLRFGLSVEVQTEFFADSNVGLLVIDTDSRSDSPTLAAKKVESIAKQIHKMGECWIYKKTKQPLQHLRLNITAIYLLPDGRLRNCPALPYRISSGPLPCNHTQA